MIIPQNVINPFSDKFLQTWQLWKHWRKTEHDNFEYKGVISEQMALKNLAELADGDEQKAIKIVEQSIDRGWSGFYKVKNIASNGTKKQPTSRKAKEQTGSGSTLRDRVQAEVTKRYGSGEQSGDEPYLKAV